MFATVLFAGQQSRPQPRLWVLQQPGEAVEYDFNTFEQLRSVPVPAAVMDAPRRLSINQHGQMLAALPDNRIWMWDGKSGRTFNSGASRSEVLDVSVFVTEVSPSWFLGSGGTHLYVGENTFRKVLNPDVELYTFTRFRVWRTDLSGQQRELIDDDEFLQCHCETGVCADTCPQGMLSTRGGIVDDSVIVVTDWTPGLRQPQFHRSFSYRKTTEGWSESEAHEPVDFKVPYSFSVQNGRLTIEDGPSRRETPIRVRTAADALVVLP
jgi:hypothetical protein